MSTSKNNNNNKVTPNPDPVVDISAFLNGPPAVSLNDDDDDNDGTSSVTATLLVDSRCLLGECVIYDDRTNSVLFTSILENKFHRLPLSKAADGSSSKLETYALPKMLCAFCLLDTNNNNNNNNNNNDSSSSSSSSIKKKIQYNDNTYLVAWEDGFQIYDLTTNTPLSDMSVGESVNPKGLPERLNDGRCDPTGTRFICGGHTATNPGPMKVYKCEKTVINNNNNGDGDGNGNDNEKVSLKHTPIVDEIYTTNSICFSYPDGKTMYLADSPTEQIQKYDYDLETGTLSNKRLFHQKAIGKPDGSIVDADGYVWNATWNQGNGTGMVDRIHPTTGKVVFTVHLPDSTSEASCCCIGGPNLDILFITTAWENLDPSTEEHAGGLYAVKLPEGMKGVKEQRFSI